MLNTGKRVGRALLCTALALGISCGSSALALTCGVVNSQTGLKLRSAASTNSATTAIIGYGTQVEVLSFQDGWCSVNVNGQTGYMAEEYLDITSTNEAAAVNVTAVNMRSLASTSSSVITLLHKGDTVTLTAVQGDWSQVDYNGTAGFIYSKYLTLTSSSSPAAEQPAAQTATMYITGFGVNFRTEPTTASEIYEVLPFGTEVTRLDATDSWTKVTYNGRTGYVYNSYISSSPNTLASDILAKAAEYLGTSYVYGGSSPSGFDCSGLTQYVFGCYDIKLSRSANSQIGDGVKVTKSDLRPGDLVFFSEGNTGYATHVGIYAGNGTFIHSSNRGVVYNNLTDPYYCNYYLCAVRVL